MPAPNCRICRRSFLGVARATASECVECRAVAELLKAVHGAEKGRRPPDHPHKPQLVACYSAIVSTGGRLFE
jgi:hypothetical protein